MCTATRYRLDTGKMVDTATAARFWYHNSNKHRTLYQSSDGTYYVVSLSHATEVSRREAVEWLESNGYAGPNNDRGDDAAPYDAKTLERLERLLILTLERVLVQMLGRNSSQGHELATRRREWCS